MAPAPPTPGSVTCVVMAVDGPFPADDASASDAAGAPGGAAAHALAGMPAAEYILARAARSIVICFLGEFEAALLAARRARRVALGGRASDAPPRIGIDVGCVRVVSDAAGRGSAIGDGVEGARRLAALAAPGQALVSREYRDIAARLAPEHARWLRAAAPGIEPAGTRGARRPDEREREQGLYELEAAEGAPDDPGTTAGVGSETEPPVAGAASVFDPALLNGVASALAREIGPAATLIVRRAAERAGDERALGRLLAESAAAAGRAALLTALIDVVRVLPEADPGDAGEAHAADAEPETAVPERSDPHVGDAGPESSISPAALAHAARLLTRQLGPAARLLVAEAARRGGTVRDLFERLAIHIDDADRRRIFLAEADRAE